MITDLGSAVALDAAGDVFVVGILHHADNSIHEKDYVVIKFSGSNGAELWRQEYDVGQRDIASCVTIDAAGDVITGGSLQVTNGEFTVIKLDGGTGQELWHYQYNGNGPSVLSTARDLAVTSSGDVIAAGSTHIDVTGGTYSDSTVIRLDGGNGTAHWVERFGEPNSPTNEHARTVVLDASDDAYVGGNYGHTATNGTIMSIRKLDGGSGSTLWHTGVVGSHNGPTGMATSLVLDSGYLYVGGWLKNEISDTDMTLLRLDLDTGKGKKLNVFDDFNRVLNPIWENELIWVFGYEDIEKLNALIETAIKSDPDLEDAIWTESAETILSYPGRIGLLTPLPEDEIMALETIMILSETFFCERSAPAVLFLQEGGAGEEFLLNAIKEGSWASVECSRKAGSGESARVGTVVEKSSSIKTWIR